MSYDRTVSENIAKLVDATDDATLQRIAESMHHQERDKRYDEIIKRIQARWAMR